MVAGQGRLRGLLDEFVFGPDELAALSGVVGEQACAWLRGRRLGEDISAYAEGETYFPGSPRLTVESCFGEGLLLETLVLSVLSHDSAVASAAARMVTAAGGRPLIEMGSRRTSEQATVAAARATYVAGFAGTSNLEARRRHGVPTAGTNAHAFTLAADDEKAGFRAQVATRGTGTTLLVDTYVTDRGSRNAVEAAAPQLGAVRRFCARASTRRPTAPSRAPSTASSWRTGWRSGDRRARRSGPSPLTEATPPRHPQDIEVAHQPRRRRENHEASAVAHIHARPGGADRWPGLGRRAGRHFRFGSVLLACPLIMMFMMGGMHGGRHDSHTDRTGERPGQGHDEHPVSGPH